MISVRWSDPARRPSPLVAARSRQSASHAPGSSPKAGGPTSNGSYCGTLAPCGISAVQRRADLREAKRRRQLHHRKTPRITINTTAQAAENATPSPTKIAPCLPVIHEQRLKSPRHMGGLTNRRNPDMAAVLRGPRCGSPLPRPCPERRRVHRTIRSCHPATHLRRGFAGHRRSAGLPRNRAA